LPIFRFNHLRRYLRVNSVPSEEQCQPSIAHDFAVRAGARGGKIASARRPDYSSLWRN